MCSNFFFLIFFFFLKNSKLPLLSLQVKVKIYIAQLAQSVEHVTLNARIMGSSPTLGGPNILCQDPPSNENFTGTSRNKIKSEFEMSEK